MITCGSSRITLPSRPIDSHGARFIAESGINAKAQGRRLPKQSVRLASSHLCVQGSPMFLILLLVTLLIAVLTSTVVMFLFNRPVERILSRLVSEELAATWKRYILFAIYVVGISSGVRFWDLEKYITPRGRDDLPLALTADRWILEVYKTIIGTLQGVAWMLLVFFLFALVAFVVVRGFELRRVKGKSTEDQSATDTAVPG